MLTDISQMTPQTGTDNSRIWHLRAERDNSGNGRVYEISFTADDGFESCDGSVVVTVPLTRKGNPAVDDGQLFDSTLP